jgi:hypothetical protein
VRVNPTNSPSFHNYGNNPPTSVLDLGCGQGYVIYSSFTPLVISFIHFQTLGSGCCDRLERLRNKGDGLRYGGRIERPVTVGRGARRYKQYPIRSRQFVSSVKLMSCGKG